MKIFKTIFIVATIITVNLPLVYVIVNFPSHDVLFAIIGHAPNQFLFLLAFFPLAIYGAVKTAELVARISKKLENAHPDLFWGTPKSLGLILAISVVVGAIVSFADADTTPSDIYQWEKEAVKDAILLNQKIVLAWEAGAENDQPLQKRQIDQMEIYYKEHAKPHSGNPTIMWLEAIELSVVGFVGTFFILLIYASLKLNGVIKKLQDDELRKNTLSLLKKSIPYGIVFTSAVLFWPVFRLYNIQEIKIVVDQYPTVAPYLIYGFAALISVVLIWIYFGKLHSGVWEKTIAILPLVFSGGIMGLTGLSPKTLVYIVGSGMGIANFLILGLLLLAIALFGTEIWKQAFQRSSPG